MSFSLEDRPGSFLTERRATVAGLALLAAWTALALWRLPAYGHFLWDEAHSLDQASDIAQRLLPAADGPPVSATNGSIPGGGFYDLMAPPFLLSRDPRAGTVWVILLTAAGIVFLDRALRALAATPRLRLIAVTLATFAVNHARFSDRLWSPHAFLFATPLLLWLSARLRSATEPSWTAIAGWGLAASLLPQLHILGVVPIALCAIVAWPGLWRGRAKLVAAAAAFALGYLPYLVAEAGRHFSNTRALLAGRPRDHLLGREVWRSLVASATFLAQSDAARPEQFWGLARGAWRESLETLTFWIALALLPIGLCVRGAWRAACAVGLALVPITLAASGRDYYVHYIVGPWPFYFLPAAAALSFLAGTGRKASMVVASYLALYGCLGALRVVDEYGPASAWSIGQQVEIASHLLEVGAPIRPAPQCMLAWQPDVYRVLARRLFRRELRLEPGAPRAASCDLTPSGAAHPTWRRWDVGGQTLACGP